jgi:Tol biopolymer transport system component
MKSFFWAAFLIFCFCPVSHAARIDTSFVFSSIETPNFSIHYHQGLEAVARKAALIAEDVHVKLTQQFDWHPEEKTQLVLIDNSDFANGFASALPYNTIYVQVVPPSLESTLGEYDDWLKELITHEYAHIVTSDPARGYWKVARSIFGKPLPGADIFTELLFIVTAPPNSFMPRWWHEGMATWSESEFTGQGRGASSYYDMVFRMAVARNQLPRVDQINGDLPNWPAGNLPYLYGYRLQKYLAERYGSESLGKLSIAQSGRFPYFINNPPQELFDGKSYGELYTDMLASLRSEQEKKIAILSRAPFSATQTVTNQGERLGNPRFSPDGNRIAYTRRDPHDHTELVVTDRSGKTVLAQLRRRSSDGSISWSPDGGTLYFTQAEINRGFDVYQDLYAYQIAKDRVTRLTQGLRLGAPDLSPDGRFFAAVVSNRGSQNLAILEQVAPGQQATPRTVTAYLEQRVSAPRWSPDGASICYALRDNAGHSSLHLYQVASGEDRTLLSMDHSADQPTWSRDGSFLIFVSDETGVFNLFAYDLKSGTTYQVSHLLGGALQPDIAPDGSSVLFSSYDARGFSIEHLALNRGTWSAARGPALPLTRALPLTSDLPLNRALPLAGDLPLKRDPNMSAPAGDSSSGAVPSAAELPALSATDSGSNLSSSSSSSYRALDTLLPHFWLPRISADGSGSAVLGVFTAGADVLGYQSYALSADYSSGRGRGYGDLIYRNDYFYPTFTLQAHAEPFLYANLLQRGDYYELNQGFSAMASYPINFLESRYLLSGGYQLLDQSALSSLDGNGRFHGVNVFRGRRDNLFADLSYDSALRYPYSVSSEEGRRISLQYRRFDRNFGSDQDLSEYSAKYQEYLRLPLASPRHQVLYLRLAGALADGDLRFGQQAFQIGGVPSDLNPYPLRGYPERSVTGRYVATGTLEYRAPLFYPMRGPGTLPAFAQKVHGALFVDAGEVWDDANSFSGNKLLVGAGFEARLDLTLGYWLKVTPALGFAHGFNSGGENRVYLTAYIDL